MKRRSVLFYPATMKRRTFLKLIQDVIEQIPSKYDYEIILVDDGSNDSTRKNYI